MAQEMVCRHCGGKYQIEKPEFDDGCCSYECWEKINCRTLEIVPPDKFAFSEAND
jgi:rubredoxin